MTVKLDTSYIPILFSANNNNLMFNTCTKFHFQNIIIKHRNIIYSFHNIILANSYYDDNISNF